MQELQMLLQNLGFESVAEVTVTEENGYVRIARPCGMHAPQTFCCKSSFHPPVAIIKRRPAPEREHDPRKQSKAIATLILLPDRTSWFKKGGLSIESREVLSREQVAVCNHERL